MPDCSMAATQDIEIVGNSPLWSVVTGQFNFFHSNDTLNAVAVSMDGGMTYTFSDLGGDPNIPARYSSNPSPTDSFVVSGTWPPSKSTKRRGTPITRNIHLHHSGTKAAMHFEFEHDDETDPDTPDWAGVIQRSNDGFQTWTTVYTNDTFYFNQIACPSSLICYAAAENDDFGYGFVTRDGGATWENTLVAPGTSLMAAQYVSDSEAYLAGGVLSPFGINGTVFHTVDTGKTWTTTLVPGYYFTDLSFVNADLGFGTAMDIEQQCNVLKFA